MLADKGPRLSALLGGVSFCRLFLKLVEKREPQVWTMPNLVTALRIAGVVVVAMRTGPHKPPATLAEAENPLITAATAAAAPTVLGLEDWIVCLLGFCFVFLDLLDGFLARALAQQTKLGAELDGMGDALGTGWLALTLYTKSRLPRLLALHLAAAPYLWSLVNLSAPPRTLQGGKHPWARPAAGGMAFFSVMAVALPAALGPSALFIPGFDSVESLARTSAVLAGLINVASFGLSYLTFFGVEVPGNGLGEHAHSK